MRPRLLSSDLIINLEGDLDLKITTNTGSSARSISNADTDTRRSFRQTLYTT